MVGVFLLGDWSGDESTHVTQNLLLPPLKIYPFHRKISVKILIIVSMRARGNKKKRWAFHRCLGFNAASILQNGFCLFSNSFQVQTEMLPMTEITTPTFPNSFLLARLFVCVFYFCCLWLRFCLALCCGRSLTLQFLLTNISVVKSFWGIIFSIPLLDKTSFYLG